MYTYRQVYEDAAKRLKDQGIFEYESNAWLLFSKAFGMTRLNYLMDSGKEATREGKEILEEYLNKRILGMPVQYIIGEAEFMGNTFEVNESVLIPRFDTEVLVEQAIRKLEGKQDISVLDMCTGSGCIIISIAKAFGEGRFCGSDISEGALAVARNNSERLETIVDFVQGNLFENITEKYDIIVSNPPYIADWEIETLEDEVKLREPRLALSGGEDGLDFYRIIVKDAIKHLKSLGWLMLEIGCDQGEAVSKLMNEAGYKGVSVVKDLAGLDRVVIGGIE